jgi:ADP-ribose pyrophosphatase
MTDESLAWDTLSSSVAYSCPGFDLVHDDVRLPDGTATNFDYCSEPESVVVLPFRGDGPDRSDDADETAEVVVIEEWRHAVDRVNRGLPAGNVEPDDDDLAAAARRELTEETGHQAGSVEHLVSVEPANGLLDSVNHYFVARHCAPTADQNLDHDETIRVDSMAWRDLRESVREGDVRDGRTVLGVGQFELAQ